MQAALASVKQLSAFASGAADYLDIFSSVSSAYDTVEQLEELVECAATGLKHLSEMGKERPSVNLLALNLMKWACQRAEAATSSPGEHLLVFWTTVTTLQRCVRKHGVVILDRANIMALRSRLATHLTNGERNAVVSAALAVTDVLVRTVLIFYVATCKENLLYR